LLKFDPNLSDVVRKYFVISGIVPPMAKTGGKSTITDKERRINETE
jgi:hypothetical protein